ncbi:hypothetical protein Asi03nite_62600 [Actinoplanes siamensis]|uniref:Uncharacterized protein n=1 Tax=Actinoplanes siamensis TaxID=1223317 RepID=A0A919TNH0_9ACTN|nr:hypothetical protein Asi03nite_62600 [Actinoplanes siamensis]
MIAAFVPGPPGPGGPTHPAPTGPPQPSTPSRWVAAMQNAAAVVEALVLPVLRGTRPALAPKPSPKS